MAVLLTLGNVLLPLLYLVVFGLYLWLFLDDNPWPRKVVSQLAASTCLIHVGVLTVRGFTLGRLPMGSSLEFLSVIAFSMLATYLIIEKRIRVKSTGMVITGMIFLLQFISSSFTTTIPEASPLLKDPGFAGHAVLVMLSYTALCISFLYAILYLVQVRQLDRHQFGLLFRRLPPLDVLERMSIGAVKIGVPLMFLALCLGHLWMYDLADRLPSDMADKLTPWDPKILTSWVIFLGYLVGLVGNRFFGWRGRGMNRIAVIAFIVIIVSLGLMHHFVPSFHDFTSTTTAWVQPHDRLPCGHPFHVNGVCQ
jgi:HemX protein